MRRILWIDDAAGYMFRPIVRMLARRRFDVKVLRFYREAIEELDHLGEINRGRPQAMPDVIVDLLIPSTEGGALDSLEVGFALANRCASLGSKRVVIFSVVSRARVSHDFGLLESAFPGVSFFYLEKTAARPDVLVDRLTEYLGEAMSGVTEKEVVGA